MSRTDQLRRGGARERGGGGGGAPFVVWGDHYAWLEGVVESVWQTQYGPAVTMKVTNTGGDSLRTKGKNEDGQETRGTVAVGEEVNVGLNNKMLEGAITQDDEGAHVHVAFEGWQEPKGAGANRYRVFAVLEMEPADARAVPGENAPTTEEVRAGMSRQDDYGPKDEKSDLPF